MTDRPLWLDHPLEDTPAAAAVSGTEQPAWEAHAIVDTPSTAPAPPAEGYDLYRKVTDEANQALTFGLSDKVGAGVLAGGHALGLSSPYDVAGKDDTFSEAYHKNLDAIRQEGEKFHETNPKAAMAAEGAGMVGGVASLPSRGAAAVAGLLPKIVEGAKVGGTAGGLAGFGGSKDESVTGDLAATGAGAATGVAIGGTTAGVPDRVAAPIYNWLSRLVSPASVNKQAVQAIARRMTQDSNAGGPTAQNMMDMFNAAPDKPQALIDVAGENVRAYGGQIAGQPGEARQFSRDTLNQRDVGAGPRIASDVDHGISSGGSAYDTNEALMQARSAAAAPHYDKAYQQQNVWSPRLQNFLDDPVMQQGLRRGMELERIDSVTQNKPFNPTQMGVDLDPEGNVKIKDVPNLRVLDAGKRGLDSMIADERNAITGRLSQRGVSLDQFRRAYLGELDSADTSGSYAAARAAYAGPSSSADAMRAGQSVLDKRPEEITSEVSKLRQNSPSDVEFYKLGAADAIKEKIAKTGMGGDEAKRLVGNQYTQNQLRPLFDTQPDYDHFINSVTAENRMFGTRHAFIGGSQSAERLAEDAGNEGPAGHMVRAGVAAMEGAPGAAGLSAMKALGSMSRGESPAVNSAAARILFRPQTDPQVPQNLRDIILAQEARTKPRLLAIPASAAAGANPAPTLANALAAGQYLPSGH